MKPENAINVPEKYRKPPSETKPTETERWKETTEVVREEEKYDIDPRQAAMEEADLSKVKVFNQTSVVIISIDDNVCSSSLPLINKTQRCLRTELRSGRFSREKRKCREI